MRRSSHPPRVSPEGKRGDAVDWREQAACRDYPFKPNVPGKRDYDPWDPLSAGKQATSAAMVVCWEVCPVRETCLEDALTKEFPSQTHGIRGGMTAVERKALLRRRAKLRRAAAKAAEAAQAIAEAEAVAQAEAEQEDTEAA
ncbi:hypothetical protein CGQ24_08295 [Arthrobacter sp. 7749]|nr:hypothetical protein CGQ24_08295 [Arthrobacter sp. 7749]